MLERNLVERVLVLGAHPDDGEFGCGATMAKFVEQGIEVFYVMFSLCEESLPEGLHKDTLRFEATDSAKKLGLEPENLKFFEFPVRRLPEYRQEVLEEMILLRNELKPNLVLLPSNMDLHQDHATVAAEGWRAFKMSSILGYEQAWNNLSFPTQYFSIVNQGHIDQKVAALNEYKSQQFRSYSQGDFIKSLASVRGTQIGQKAAEAFEVIRWIA